MKKSLLLLILFLLLASTPALAADGVKCGQNSSTPTLLCNPLAGKANDAQGITRVIILGMQAVILIIGGTSIIYVVYSGARMILSQGSSEEIQRGKDILKWAIFGFGLSLISFVLISSLANFFGYQGLPISVWRDSSAVGNVLATENFGTWISGTFLTNFLSFAGILAILMIVISGFRYVTAQGHEEQSTEAKTALKWAVIGLVLITLAYVIIRATEALIAGR